MQPPAQSPTPAAADLLQLSCQSRRLTPADESAVAVGSRRRSRRSRQLTPADESAVVVGPCRLSRRSRQFPPLTDPLECFRGLVNFSMDFLLTLHLSANWNNVLQDHLTVGGDSQYTSCKGGDRIISKVSFSLHL